MILICIMGDSKSGKSTVERGLKNLGFKASISYTTRKINTAGHTGEVDGIDYHFVDEIQFKQLVDKGMLVEYEKLYDNYYGTPKLFGSTRYVAVVGLQGYLALKNLYRGQVLGVYLKADAETLKKHGETCDKDFVGSDEDLKRRAKDSEVSKKKEELADVVIDSSIGVNNIIASILKEAQKLDKTRR